MKNTKLTTDILRKINFQHFHVDARLNTYWIKRHRYGIFILIEERDLIFRHRHKIIDTLDDLIEVFEYEAEEDIYENYD